jgi:hypothetical protein
MLNVPNTIPKMRNFFKVVNDICFNGKLPTPKFKHMRVCYDGVRGKFIYSHMDTRIDIAIMPIVRRMRRYINWKYEMTHEIIHLYLYTKYMLPYIKKGKNNVAKKNDNKIDHTHEFRRLLKKTWNKLDDYFGNQLYKP